MTKEEATKHIDAMIKIAENEIDMLKKTVTESLSRDNYSAVGEICKMIAESQSKIHYFRDIKERGVELSIFEQDYINPFSKSDQYSGENITINNDGQRKNGIVANICGYDVYEPIKECRFVIHLPKELSITETDIIKYRATIDILEITIRNSVKCPIFELESIVENGSQLNAEIKIDTLDGCGYQLYHTVYYVDELLGYEISGGDYASSNPQTIFIQFHFTNKKSVKEGEKDEK